MGTLRNRRILITRASSQASSFSDLLRRHGAEIIELPTIQIVPRPAEELDECVRAIRRYDWLFFTSANGAEILLERIQDVQTLREAGFPKICTIGPATARSVREKGLEVDLIPETYQAEGILEDFCQVMGGRINGIRVLLPRASQARELLPEELRRLGAVVDVKAVYDTLSPEGQGKRLRQLLDSTLPDLVTFTSSSTVHNFVALGEGHPRLRELACAAIGPITAETAGDYGLRVVLQPEKSTIPHLVDAIVSYFA